MSLSLKGQDRVMLIAGAELLMENRLRRLRSRILTWESNPTYDTKSALKFEAEALRQQMVLVFQLFAGPEVDPLVALYRDRSVAVGQVSYWKVVDLVSWMNTAGTDIEWRREASLRVRACWID